MRHVLGWLIFTLSLAAIGALVYLGFMMGIATLVTALTTQVFVPLEIAIAIAKIVFSIPMISLCIWVMAFMLFSMRFKI